MEYSITNSSEVWVKLKGYEGYLEVSSEGRVRSVDRIILRKDTMTPVFKQGRVLSIQKDRQGYCRIAVSWKGSTNCLKIHRLVAMMFIPNPENKPQVNHIDGDKSNNKVSNLEWVTNSENQLHAVENGLRIHLKGEESHAFKRKVDVYEKGVYIITLCGNDDMRNFGVDYRLVSACLLGKRKTHKGYTFKSSEE